MDVEIRRLGPGDEQAVHAAAHLFDKQPEADATRRFLAEPTHHLLIAYDAEGRPVGYVSGVETTHPDKGTELFLYELAVDEPIRRHGIGRALVRAFERLARERGCYGMWVLADADNDAARATYTSAGAAVASQPVMLEWDTRAS
jgi:ribosomal protein S18 acetylase RimI-like enzyme